MDDTWILNRKHQIVLCVELALEEAMGMSSDRQQNEWTLTIATVTTTVAMSFCSQSLWMEIESSPPPHLYCWSRLLKSECPSTCRLESTKWRLSAFTYFLFAAHLHFCWQFTKNRKYYKNQIRLHNDKSSILSEIRLIYFLCLLDRASFW